ncbi:heterokaryon incompatibility protein-domain-containing protein [Xylariaceae sp. AK1471]|nr:heterokaryon incompatibility protein-domain-containing protein [Xylariaceae sp. AK1471]
MRYFQPSWKLFRSMRPQSMMLCHIHRNLFSCLKKLARQKYDKWIWIDGICINQQDDLEKCTQIPLMREIYAGASEVLAWLGDANPLESRILEVNTRRAIQASLSNPSPELQILRPGPPGPIKDLMYTPMLLPLVKKGLVSIFHRPYFSRIWVQQEVVLGKRVFMLFGDTKTSWDIFADFANTCRYQGQPYTDDIINLKRISDNWHSKSPDHDEMVNAIMFLARHKQAMEPRDRVYGILGLCPTEGLHHLTVDVNHSLAEVYIQFAKWNLSMGRFQDILEKLDYAHHFPGLPSWCPNLMWHEEASIHWDVYSAGYKNEETENRTPGMGQPEPKEAPETRFLNPRVLVLTATLAIDHVHAVLPWDDGIEGKNSRCNWSRLSKWDSACLRLSEKDSEEQLLAHAATMVAGRLEGLPRFVSPLPYHADPIRCYKLWKGWLSVLAWRIPMIRMTLPAEFFDYNQCMRSVCTGQCYFVTTSGRRGICSKDTRPRDVVIVTRNAKSPAIVRPAASVEERMTLIGPAYVHGIMNGEALESINNGDRHWEEIFIQ